MYNIPCILKEGGIYMLPNSSKYVPSFKWVPTKTGGLKKEPINMKKTEVKQMIEDYRKLDQEQKEIFLKEEQEREKKEKQKKEEFRKKREAQKQEEEIKKRYERLQKEKEAQKRAAIEAAYEQNKATEIARKQKEIIQSETEFLSKVILSSWNHLTNEQLRDASTRLLIDEESFESLVEAYAKTTKISLDHSDQCTVTRKALTTVLDEATTRIEKSHCEFTQITPAKTISR